MYKAILEACVKQAIVPYCFYFDKATIAQYVRMLEISKIRIRNHDIKVF